MCVGGGGGGGVGKSKIDEPPHGKTNNLHMRKLRRRSASRLLSAKLISAFASATWIVHFLFILNRKFQASSLIVWLYSLICIRPVRKPHCWFSHETAQMLFAIITCSCHQWQKAGFLMVEPIVSAHINE